MAIRILNGSAVTQPEPGIYCAEGSTALCLCPGGERSGACPELVPFQGWRATMTEKTLEALTDEEWEMIETIRENRAGRRK